MLKKRFTRLTVLCLCVGIILSMGSTALATESNCQVKTYYENGILVTEETWILTTEEAIQELMERKGLSRQAAASIMISISPLNASASTTYIAKKIKTYTYASYKVEIGGMFEFATDGQYTQVNKCLDIWTAASGSGNYTWEEYTLVDANQDKYPWLQIHLLGRGCIQVAVDTTAGGVVSAQLLGAGFSVSSSIGSTTYYRLVIDLELKINMFT